MADRTRDRVAHESEEAANCWMVAGYSDQLGERESGCCAGKRKREWRVREGTWQFTRGRGECARDIMRTGRVGEWGTAVKEGVSWGPARKVSNREKNERGKGREKLYWDLGH